MVRLGLLVLVLAVGLIGVASAETECNEAQFWKSLSRHKVSAERLTSCHEVVSIITFAREARCMELIPAKVCSFAQRTCPGLECSVEFMLPEDNLEDEINEEFKAKHHHAPRTNSTKKARKLDKKQTKVNEHAQNHPTSRFVYAQRKNKNTGHDIIDLVLADHVRFEWLLRSMRNITADRKALLRQFSYLLVAHSEAEEEYFYPKCRELDPNEDKQVHHEEGEHTEGLQALLDVMEDQDVYSAQWAHKLKVLSEKMSHHLDEEEQHLINFARVNMTADVRSSVGAAFWEARQRHLDAGCGELDNVRKMVHERPPV